jgi:hypothetical protein
MTSDLMDKPAFRSDLFYSVQNEDYRTELAVLKRVHRGAPLRVLMVASAGENPLSVLADPMVGEVHAVDTNPAQVERGPWFRTVAAGFRA